MLHENIEQSRFRQWSGKMAQYFAGDEVSATAHGLEAEFSLGNHRDNDE